MKDSIEETKQFSN